MDAAVAAIAALFLLGGEKPQGTGVPAAKAGVKTPGTMAPTVQPPTVAEVAGGIAAGATAAATVLKVGAGIAAAGAGGGGAAAASSGGAIASLGGGASGTTATSTAAGSAAATAVGSFAVNPAVYVVPLSQALATVGVFAVPAILIIGSIMIAAAMNNYKRFTAFIGAMQPSAFDLTEYERTLCAQTLKLVNQARYTRDSFGNESVTPGLGLDVGLVEVADDRTRGATSEVTFGGFRWVAVPRSKVSAAEWRQFQLRVRALALEYFEARGAYGSLYSSGRDGAKRSPYPPDLSTIYSFPLIGGDIASAAEQEAARSALSSDARKVQYTAGFLAVISVAGKDPANDRSRRYAERFFWALTGHDIDTAPAAEWAPLGRGLWLNRGALMVPINDRGNPGAGWEQWSFGPIDTATQQRCAWWRVDLTTGKGEFTA